MLNIVEAALKRAHSLNVKNLRNCDNHWNNTMFGPANEKDLEPYQRGIRSLRDLIDFKSKVIDFTLLDGTTEKILIDAKNLFYVDPSFIVKIEEEDEEEDIAVCIFKDKGKTSNGAISA